MRTSVLFVAGNAVLASIWSWAAFRQQGGDFGRSLVVLAAAIIAILTLWWVAAILVRLRTVSGWLPALHRSTLAIAAALVLVFFFPEYLLGQQPPLWRTLSLLAVGGALYLYLLSIAGAREATVERSGRAKMYLVAFGTSYFLVLSYLAIRKYQVMGYVGQDLAYFAQCFYTTVHGKFFEGNVLQDLLYARTVNSDFAGHNSLVMLLFVPFYYLQPSPVTLLLLRNVFIVFCAWPAYLIARRSFSPVLSGTMAVSLLLLPCMIYQNVFDFYPLSLAAFFLLFTFYYYLEGRFVPFVILSTLTLFVREDLVFVIFAFGVLALFQRVSRRWAAVPILMAVAWGLLSFKIVMPHFLRGSPYVADVCFAHVGATPAEMVHNIAVHPVRMLLRHGNVIYLKELITPFGVGGVLLSPVSLFTAPYLGINLLGGGGPCLTTLIYAQYSVVPTVILFVGFVLTLTKIRGMLARRGVDGPRASSVAVAFVLALCVASICFATEKREVREFQRQPWNDEAMQVAALVPPDAAVAVPRYLLPYLANRERLYQTHRFYGYHHADPQYVIIDRDWERIVADARWEQDYARLQVQMAQDARFQVIYKSPNYIVYRKSPASMAGGQERGGGQ